MDIRILTEEDIDQYITIRLNCLQNSPEAFGSTYEEEVEYTKERMLKRLTDENVTTFGAFADDSLVGVVSLTCQARMRLKHRSTISGFYVENHLRNSGIGRSLVKRAIEEARNTGHVEQISLAVVTTNFIAKRLYKSLGFQPYAVEKRALKVGDKYFDEDLMILSL